jgi:hypothetical protein
VVRAEGKLDERTRMINVVIRVDKPYETKPPLAAGLFVTVEIKGRTLENALMLPRSALRENNIVWVVDENGQLTFRKVSVARLTSDAVLVEGGLKDGEMVVVSSLKAVTDGMQVRFRQAQEANAS